MRVTAKQTRRNRTPCPIVRAIQKQVPETQKLIRTRKRPSCARVCLKIHSCHLHIPLCGIFVPNSVNVARYASLIRDKSPTNWDAQMSESNFQTHPRALLKHAKSYFCRQNGPRSRKREKLIDRQRPVKLPKKLAAYFLMAKNRKHDKNDRNLRERK